MSVQSVRCEALQGPLVGAAGGGRTGQSRADDVREVLEVAHHLGTVQGLIDQRRCPRGIYREVLRPRGSGSGGQGDDRGGRGGDGAAAHRRGSIDRCGGIGSVTVTVVPTPTFELTAMLPPNMLRTTLWTTTNPMPLPSPNSLVV